MSNSVNLSLDVTKTGIQNPLIKVRQGDGDFETLHTTVTSNGEPLDLQGWTITFMGTTAGNHKIVDGNVNIVEAPNGIFDYTPSKAWGMDIGGFKMAYFKFVKGDGSASSANFRVSVIEAVDLTQDEAKNYISVVDATIADVRQRLTNSLASVTASVATTSSAVSSLAVSASSVATSAVDKVNTTTSSAVNQINSAASSASSVATSAANNVSSVASNAVANVNSASNTFLKKSNQLPAEARDFNYLATHMQTYQGIWWVGNEIIANAPIAGWNSSTIEVVPGNAETAGVIRTSRFGTNATYSANVNSGKLGPWLPLTPSSRNATFSDLAVVAKSMSAYAGTWYAVGKQNIQNGPTIMNFNSIITVVNSWDDAGFIIVSSQGYNTWIGGVAGGNIQHWTFISDDANVVHNTGTETITGDKTFTGNITASGTLDAKQKVYTRTIGSTNDLQIIYTRVGNLVTGRYTAAKAGVFTLSNNDGYKCNAGYTVNVIAQNINAWFTTDNRFAAPDGASQGNFMFITSDPLPTA